jgi:hypothetical protein
MMLHEKLPDSVTVNGRRYRLDLDFRNVLRMMDVMDRKDLLPGARAYVALKCVMKRPPKDATPVLAAVNALLFPARKKSEKREKLTDLKQDADLIRAAFLQSYGVNLWRDRLHWFEFSGLLACIPGGSRYADIIGIRARPMPEATKYNAKEREWLMKAKAEYAVEMTAEEQERSYQEGLHNMAMSLLAIAQKGGGTDGE